MALCVSLPELGTFLSSTLLRWLTSTDLLATFSLLSALHLSRILYFTTFLLDYGAFHSTGMVEEGGLLAERMQDQIGVHEMVELVELEDAPNFAAMMERVLLVKPYGFKIPPNKIIIGYLLQAWRTGRKVTISPTKQ